MHRDNWRRAVPWMASERLGKPTAAEQLNHLLGMPAAKPMLGLKAACLNAPAGSLHIRPCLVAGRPPLEDFLHRRPIGLAPATAVALVPVSRHTDLGKVELGTTIGCVELKNCDGVVICWPVESPPGLNNLLPSSQRQVEARNVSSPGRKAATDLSADRGGLA